MNRSNYYPELVTIIASTAWGLFWLPLRAFERQGIAPGWTTLFQFLAPLIVLLPLACWRRYKRQPTGIRQLRSGVFIGLAIALYLESLLLTDVARALILFYAMPAWGTLLEIGVMGRSPTRWRILSLLLSVGGLLIILGINAASLTINLGDVLALLSGMVFAVGALQVRQSPETASDFEQLFAFFFYGSLAALALSQLPFAELGERPSLSQVITLVPWLLLIAIGFLIPVMWGVYWGSRRVDPGRLGILLQIEAVVGIGSAALLAGEPFGWQQLIGGVLVICAGLTEVILERKVQLLQRS